MAAERGSGTARSTPSSFELRHVMYDSQCVTPPFRPQALALCSCSMFPLWLPSVLAGTKKNLRAQGGTLNGEVQAEKRGDEREE